MKLKEWFSFFFIWVFGAFLALSPVSGSAVSCAKYINELDGYSMNLPYEWVEVSVHTGSLRYEDHGILLEINVTPIPKEMTLEKWLLLSQLEGSGAHNITVRKTTCRAGEIGCIPMVRYTGQVTVNEGSADEDCHNFCSYLFTHDEKGIAVKLFTDLSRFSLPEVLLDELIKSFQILPTEGQ